MKQTNQPTDGPAEPHPTELAKGLALSRGRQLKVELGASQDTIEIRSPAGDIELAIVVGPDGPRLKIRAVDIELVAENRLSMICNSIDIRASSDAKLEAGGVASLVGRDVSVTSKGEIELDANDDVHVRGERIKLNCDEPPMPTSWSEYERRSRLLGKVP